MLNMMEYIKEHGLDNVWCQPKQDTQYMIYPSRITKPMGAVKRFKLMGQSYSLPTETGLYHVYMFGQLPPSFFNIMEGSSKWRRASTICNQNKILIDLYLDNGLQFPRHDSWFIILPDKNILVAVKDQVKISSSLMTEKLAVKFYSNAFFSSERSQQPYQTVANPDLELDIDYRIYVAGRTILSAQDISDVATVFNQYMQLPGYTYGMVNGYMVSTLSAVTMQIGDLVEFVHDSTIKWVVDLPLSDLGGFTSTLDSKHKRLVTFITGLNAFEKGLVSNQTYFSDKSIYFKDDMDLFFYKDTPGNIKKGLIYPRNKTDSVRMLTHKDYSIPSSYIEGYYGTGKFFTNQSEMKLRLFLRVSGYERVLIDDCNYINELYKLVEANRQPDHEPDWFGVVTTLRSIMLGTESNVDAWKAANLEASSYCKLMRSYRSEVDEALVVNAYGHEGVKDVLNAGFWQVCDVNPPESFNVLSAVNHTANLPYASQNGYTLFKYWSDLNSDTVKYAYSGNSLSTTRQTSTGVGPFVLPVAMSRGPGAGASSRLGTKRPSMTVIYPYRTVGEGSTSECGVWVDVFSATDIIDYGGNIRFFKRLRTIVENTNEWIEFTGEDDYLITKSNNGTNNVYSVAISLDPLIWEVIFSDSAYMLNQITTEVKMNTANSRVSLTGVYGVPTGQGSGEMPFDMRYCEFFISGFYGIEGLDYYRKDRTTVVCSATLVKKAISAFLNEGASADDFTVTCMVRQYGISGLLHGYLKPTDYGFIKNGVISLNNRFDLRDERTTCLYIDGELVNIDYLRNQSIAGNKEIVSEDPGSDYLFVPELSGKPYCFVKLGYEIPGLPESVDPVALEADSVTKEQQISDYLTVRFPEAEIETPLYAEEPYELYSPFMFRVIRDVQNSVIMSSVYEPTQPTDTQIQELLADLEWLLEYDPARKNNEWWKDNVVILPHPLPHRLPVTVAQRAFLLRVNRIYFNNKLDINSHVEIVT